MHLYSFALYLHVKAIVPGRIFCLNFVLLLLMKQGEEPFLRLPLILICLNSHLECKFNFRGLLQLLVLSKLEK